MFGRAAGNHIVASKLKEQHHKHLPADGTDFDEEPLKEKHSKILIKRAELLSMYDSQRNKAHDLYNQIDQRIKDFDIKTKNIQQFFPQFGGFDDVDKQKNKKKKQKNQS